MDLTFSLKNVAPGDYTDDSGKTGALLVDRTFYCFCTQFFHDTSPPVHVRKNDLASGASIVGLSPEANWLYLCGATKVENNEAHFLDCDSVTFTYATFSGDDTPQVGYADPSNSISHPVAILKPTPVREARVFTVKPTEGKIRRLVFMAKSNTLFDAITFNNVASSGVVFDKNVLGNEVPEWAKAMTK
ncbi:hypothetical protein [Bradyrhizobium monzae]|uniref:hypothetical protein n=1 Tax=Bradyrhizobium sp. Oc8 TaxID=2876780 RepID=UPI001F4842B5|nr:hypothetical protein [Bradyrhizobium sp. Oc8]